MVFSKPILSFDSIPTELCIGETLSLSAFPPGGTFSGPGVSGNNLNTTTLPEGNISIYYQFTDANGCSDTIETNIDLKNCAETFTFNDVSVSFYPNPVVGNYLNSTGLLGESFLYLNISDITSKIVQQLTIPCSNGCPILLNNLKPGLYIIKWQSSDKTGIFKLLKISE